MSAQQHPDEEEDRSFKTTKTYCTTGRPGKLLPMSQNDLGLYGIGSVKTCVLAMKTQRMVQRVQDSSDFTLHTCLYYQSESRGIILHSIHDFVALSHYMAGCTFIEVTCHTAEQLLVIMRLTSRFLDSSFKALHQALLH